MPAESELEVKLVPDESAIEEVENREMELGGGGELSASQENTRTGIISGGFKTALLSLGIIGLLSQLKPIVGLLQAVFGIIGRALIPVVESVADILRPINQGVDEIASNLDFDVSLPDIATGAGLANIVRAGGRGLPFGIGARTFEDSEAVGESVENDLIVSLAQAVADAASGNGGGSPDQSDEADKIDEAERIRNSLTGKIGGQ